MSAPIVLKDTGPIEARELIRSRTSFAPSGRRERSLVIVDVREEAEYASGHLLGAINLDFRSPIFPELIRKLDRCGAYLVYCRTGHRSVRAVQLMWGLGFAELYNLAGGILAWKEEGFEIQIDTELRLS
jgi:rhodanese-related sulfurtransferase